MRRRKIGRSKVDLMKKRGMAGVSGVGISRGKKPHDAKPALIKTLPGAAVDRHLRLYGHLPELGCCAFDQPEADKDAV